MPKTLKLFLFLLLFTPIVLLRYSQSFAVVPYTPDVEAGTEVKATAQQIAGLNEKFKKHEQEQTQSLDAIKNKITQIEQKEILISRDNIYLKRISIVLFLFNLLFIVLLLRFMQLKALKEKGL